MHGVAATYDIERAGMERERLDMARTAAEDTRGIQREQMDLARRQERRMADQASADAVYRADQLGLQKRGLDMQSPVYLYVLDIMREGMKQFTDFTNKWKTREEETNEKFGELQAKSAREIVCSIPASSWTRVRKGGPEVRASKFVPSLPVPESKNPMRRIVFSPRQRIIYRKWY